MPTKDEVADELIAYHFNVEPNLVLVVRILSDQEDLPGEPIKLLEVNTATVATGSVEPFAFAPSKSTPFPTVIAEITEAEFERVMESKLSLPKGWSLAKAKRMIRPKAA